MFDVYILRWSISDECENYIGINFFYLKNDMIHCCLLSLSKEDFISFKKVRSKHKYLENKILNKEFILNENIEHLKKGVDEFIKRNKLEKKIRSYRIKRLLKK